MVVMLLLVGVAVQPVIVADVSIESDNSGLIEITVSICRFDSIDNHTVFMTPEKATELYGIINNFDKNMKHATTYEETVEIINEAAVSLNEYDLLPEDLNVEEAQKLMTCNNLYTKINRFMEKMGRQINDDNGNEIINSLCLVYAFIFDVTVATIDFNFFLPIFFFFLALYGFSYYEGYNTPILGWLFVFSLVYFQLKPLRLMNLIIIESNEPFSVYSIGLLGNKKTTTEPNQDYSMLGYTGIIIKFNCEPLYEFFDCNMIFIGSALRTQVDA